MVFGSRNGEDMAVGLLVFLIPLVFASLAGMALVQSGRHLGVGPRRTRVLGLLAAGLVVGAAVLVLGMTVFTSSLGLVPALAAGIGALVPVVGIIMSPGTGGARTGASAELDARGWSSLGPTWLYALPAAAVAGMTLATVFFGASSSPDDDGRYRSFTLDTGVLASGATPYPGWFYGLPVLALGLVLFVATVLALGRVARQPLRGNAEERAAARGWRAGLARVVMALSTGSFLATTGGMALLGGLATRMASTASGGSSEFGEIAWDIPVLDVLALMELSLGGAALLLGTALVVAAVAMAARR